MKKTKIFALAGMLVFFSFLVVLFIIASLNNNTSPVPSTENNTNNTMCGGNSCPMMITLNAQEVSKHNNANDCWMIINNKVYDLTTFLYLHTGGSQFILQYCGTDGSAGFNTKDGMGSHSQRDLAILNQYYLGDLGHQIKS
jgi:cytochrome b involved in lipid metabolism